VSLHGQTVALRVGGDNEGLVRAHRALYREVQRAARRRSAPRSGVEFALRASNVLVWIYAALQLLNSI
jgi:hypothetical protein